MPHPFCIEQLTVGGMEPVEHVMLAADLGCPSVSLRLEQAGGAGWSLRDDAGLRRRLHAALSERGVSICVGEGIVPSDRVAADLDLLAELGARRIAVDDRGLERDRARDQLASLGEMARERGIALALGFGPAFALGTLAAAREALRHIGEESGGLLIDSVWLFRSGGTVREIAELDPALIEYVRLSDAPRRGAADHLQEGRTIPGEAELPLREFVDALPRGQPLGLAVPPPARGAYPLAEHVAETVIKTRAVLA